MGELDATIALPNGHANGYHHDDLGGVSRAPLAVEPLVNLLEDPQPHSPAVSAEAKITPGAVSPDQPSSPAGEAKSRPTEPSQPTTRPANKHSTKPTKKATPKDPRVKYVPQAELDAEQAKLEKLSRAALAGDTEALDQLRIELDNRPHVWQRLADLQRRIETKMVELIAGNDLLLAQAFRRRCSEFRHEILDGEPASLATKMAAGRAVSCWMFCQLQELRALQSPAELNNIRAIEQAERRFQVAMRTFYLARQADLQLQRLACDNTGNRG